MTIGPLERHRLTRFAAVGFVFLLAFALRLLSLIDLGGDDHWSLWTAATFLKGDRPFRDFVDVGDPLYWGASALAQVLFGYRVLGEVVLGVTLVAFALALSFHLSWQASRSVVVAAGLTMLVIPLVAVTKLYSYPKIFVYPLGIWLCWRYIDRPTLLRAGALAVGVAVAFGYRHDHGAYVGLGSVVAVLAAHWAGGVRIVFLSLCRYGAILLLLLAPYLVFIQVHEGLVDYFRARLDVARHLDAAGRRTVPFVVDSSAPRAWVGVAPPPPARVEVLWAPGVAPEIRLALEKRYSLVGGVSPFTRLRRYDLTDFSQANLTALIEDPHVAETDGIQGSFRRAYRFREPGPSGTTVVVQWSSSLTEERRGELERRYHLVNRRGNSSDRTGRSLLYEIVDTSEANVTGLVLDPHVTLAEGTDGGLITASVPVMLQVRDPPPVGAQVAVRWAEHVTDAERAELEQQFRLTDPYRRPEDTGTGWWRYQLVDFSDANVTALAKHSRVAELDGHTDGAVPGSYRIRERPRATAPVAVRWAESVTDAERASLERRYGLRSPRAVPPPGWQYTLIDPTEANIRALLEDPRVLRADGLDRETARPTDEPWLSRLQRNVALLRLTVAPRFVHEANAGPWLYYVSYALPVLVLIILALDGARRAEPSGLPRERAKMLTAAVMMGVVNVALLRKVGYVADHADAAVVLGGWFIGRVVSGGHSGWAMRSAVSSTRKGWLGRRSSGVIAALRTALVFGILVITIVATAAYVDQANLLARIGLDRGLGDAWERTARSFEAYTASPPIDVYAPPGSLGDRGISRYVYECTRPEDRVWVLSDLYPLPYYAERRVVGHIYWAVGFLASPEHQRRTLARLEKDSVPLILGVGRGGPLQYLEAYDLIYEYVSERYVERHGIVEDKPERGLVFWLLVDSRRTPTGVYKPLALPCFR